MSSNNDIPTINLKLHTLTSSSSQPQNDQMNEEAAYKAKLNAQLENMIEATQKLNNNFYNSEKSEATAASINQDLPSGVGESLFFDTPVKHPKYNEKHMSSTKKSMNESQPPASTFTKRSNTDNSNKVSIDRSNKLLEELERRHEYELSEINFRQYQAQTMGVSEKDQELSQYRQAQSEWNKQKKQLNKEKAQLKQQVDDFRQRYINILQQQQSSNPVSHKDTQQPTISVKPVHSPGNARSKERVRDHRRIARLEKELEEQKKKADQIEQRYKRASSLVKQLDNQKKRVEQQAVFEKTKYNKDRDLTSTRDQLHDLKDAHDAAQARASSLEQENEQLQKVNSQLKTMNERYFSVLKSLSETEKALLRKESDLTQFKNQYNTVQRENRQLKRSLRHYNDTGHSSGQSIRLS